MLINKKLIVILIILAIITVGIFVFKNKISQLSGIKTGLPNLIEMATKTDETLIFNDTPENWDAYKNNLYGLSFYFPRDFKIYFDDFRSSSNNNNENSVIAYVELIKTKKGEDGKMVEKVVRITPYLNKISKTFEQYVDDLISQNETAGDYVNDSRRKIKINNYDAYTFEVKGGFTGNGYVSPGVDLYKNVQITIKKEGDGLFGMMGDYKLLFIQKDQLLFVIWYSSDDADTQKIIDSLKLFE